MSPVGAEPLRIDLGRLRQDIEALAAIGQDPTGGISRPAWSPAHEAARAWLLGRLRASGLAARVDPAGNVFGRLGEGTPVVLTGSRIDTVPRGGPLDGALGVLAGLECLHTVAASGARPTRALEVAAFTDEEGRFYGFFGSRAMTGSLDPSLAARLTDPAGLALPEAMRRAGFDLARAPEARRDPGEIAAYVELHIEQGAVARGRGRADRRRRGHRRDPPRPPDLRRSARSCRDHAHRSAERCLSHRRRVRGEEPGAGGTARSAAPSRRSASWSRAGRGEHRAGARHPAAGAARPDPASSSAWRRCPPGGPAGGAAARARPRGRAPHAGRARPDAPAIQAAIEATAAELGLPTRRMPSGAGHDAQVLAAVDRRRHDLRPEPGEPAATVPTSGPTGRPSSAAPTSSWERSSASAA